MNKLTFLHLSDLHYCSRTKNDIQVVQKAFLEDITKLVDSNPNLCPDFVIFSGDMVFDGNKDDFYSVWNDVFNPILNTLNLGKDRFFFCPGNHDIERGKIKDYIEAGLVAKLTSREAVNNLIDNLASDDSPIFSRLDNFNEFNKSLENEHIIKRHQLFSVYKLEIGKKTIGVACMNSAWRAQGDDKNDLGKLLMGERSFLTAIDAISTCDIRIGVVHHPFGFLTPFEQIDLERQAFRSFNIWLHGHQHEQNFEHIKPLTEEGILFIAGGALYNSRDYHNGYNLIYISLDENKGNIYFREYFDRTKIFADAVAYAEKGIISFELPQNSIPLNRQSKIVSQIRQAVNTGSFNILESAIAELSRKPKTLDKVFVEPPLAAESEESFRAREVVRQGKKNIVKSKEETLRSLADLLNSDDNILFAGKKESGKTSLLKHIFNLYLTAQGGVEKIPVLINHKNLPPGKDHILTAIKSQILSLGIIIDIQTELEQGNCLVLIDDFSFENEKSLKDFVLFAKRYSNNRFLITTDQGTMDDIGVAELPNIGIKYEKVYIHSLKRKQVKELVKKWFDDANLAERNIDDLSEQVLTSISVLNVPSSPLIVSLLLLVSEQQIEYIPINRATLVEKFVEILLQKMNSADTQAEGLDFRIKEDLLSHIAYYMDNRAEYQLTSTDFYNEIESYFRNRGLISPRQLESFVYNNFVTRGILTEYDGKIFFRFSCFTEYFIAKYLAENGDFLKRIMYADEIWLSYFNEIDYLTGLQRKNKDLVEFIGERAKVLTNEYFTQSGLDITLEKLGNMSFEPISEPKANQEDTIRKLRKARLTTEERDEMLDEVPLQTKNIDQSMVRKAPSTLDAKAIGSLLFLATTIKNCELIADKEFKKYYVNFCIELYLKFIYIAVVKISEQISNIDEENFVKYAKELNVEAGVDNLEVFKSKIATFLPLLITAQIIEIMRLTLATPKLEVVFDEEITNQDNHVAKRLVYSLLYADLKLPAYLDKLEKIIKEIIKNDFYCEIVKQKLLYYYHFRKLTAKQKNQIENMIAGIDVRNMNHSNQRKTSAIAQLRSQYKIRQDQD